MNKSAKNEIDVLIVGAGPTGLALAGYLAKANSLAKNPVRLRIIDKSPNPSDKSKALAVHAGTLEAIEEVYGEPVSQKMVNTGIPASQFLFHIYDKEPISADLTRIPSKYNFILVLEQYKTEMILEEELQRSHIQVEREQELISLSSDDAPSNSVLCKIRNQKGKVEAVQAKFVVGCDGAHSTVRQCAHIPFKGGTYPGEFILGDVKVEWPWQHGVIHGFVSKKGAMACFPLKGEKRYGFILFPDKQRPKGRETSETIPFDEFHEIASSLAPAPIKVLDPVWTTRFNIHHRIVRTFRKGRVFLAGDAAHIHSPVGGQGMNTGIQEAFNLGHKLSFVLQENLDESLSEILLEHYESERMPIARNVLHATHLASRLILLKENRIVKFLRSQVLPTIIGQPWIQKRVLLATSEIGVSRRDMEKRKN